MKLDATVMRTMSKTDFRVLEAVEMGMKDHYLVPMPLIHTLSNLRHGGCHKIISSLLRDKLLSHERNPKKNCDGYRLTNSGYDILALHNLKSRGFVAALGRQRIGTGKESDIYLAASPKDGTQVVLKFHRLGRTSFRNVRKKRDYFNNNNKQNMAAHSWLTLSKLSATKEYAFLKSLYEHGYPTPTPIAHNRHVLVMSLVRGTPLYQILPKQISPEQAKSIYKQSVQIATRLAKVHGLIHCDLNEFNLLVDLSGIQNTMNDDKSDPYVRHSGASVVMAAKPSSSVSVGALSKPAWEEALLLQQQQQQSNNTNHQHHLDSVATTDNDAEDQQPVTVEAAAARLLSNGQPEPVVTLIDFPQMVSVSHPNAKYYWERDIACLRRFFERKLKISSLDDDDNDESLRRPCWDDIVGTTNNNGDDDDDPHQQKQGQRLDKDLNASGFGGNQFRDDLELYYFQSGPRPIGSAILHEEEYDDDDDDDDDDAECSSEGQVEHHSDSGGDFKETEACVQDDDEEEVAVHDVDNVVVDNEEDVDEDNDDGAEIASQTIMENLSILDEQQLRGLDREQLVAMAKERVRRQVQGERRKSRQKGAFRSRNSNKNFVKGKRVMKESIF